MAVGSLTGPQLDQSGFMNVVPTNTDSFDPSTMLSTNPTLSSSFPASQQTWDAGMTPGMTGNIDWSQPQQAPTPTPQTLQSQFMNMGGEMLGLGSGTGGIGAAVGMSDNGVGQENSDEYWNALIDGQSIVHFGLHAVKGRGC